LLGADRDQAAPGAPSSLSRLVLPPHAPGLRIGLFGGSFNPPHAAHRAASLYAMKRLGLDRIWWLVTPGNPLKDTTALPPLDQRLAAASALARHPRIDVTGLEAVIKTRYTYDTVAYLTARCPSVRFVWVMGADNLKQFHHWQRWQGIAALVPIAVVDREPGSLRAAASVAALALAPARISDAVAKSLPERSPPAWVYLHGLKSPISSTALRNQKSGGGRLNLFTTPDYPNGAWAVAQGLATAKGKEP
jgi:nicotinate-nucleotide adenylyltransferase